MPRWSVLGSREAITVMTSTPAFGALGDRGPQVVIEDAGDRAAEELTVAARAG